jgi:uncharacterized membrane protein
VIKKRASTNRGPSRRHKRSSAETPESGYDPASDTKATSVDQVTRRNVDSVAKLEIDNESHRTLGERCADLFAAMVGSWTFIIIQAVLLAIWVVLNVIAWSYKWDPYPFILLNLALSFQAAFASPIIMMSQNRQAQIADKRNRLDLQINLLAEQEATTMLRLLRRLCEANGINIDDESCAALEQETSTQQMLQQIDRAEELVAKSSHSLKRRTDKKPK